MSVMGSNIKRLREKNKLSQDELAEKLYCTRQTISNYERGISEPDIDTIKKIAEIFNCDIKEIIEADLKRDNKLIIRSFIKTVVILIFCAVIYFVSLGLFPYYFNNALLLCGMTVIPFGMYIGGLFIGDLFCFFGHEIKNNSFKRYLRAVLVGFIVCDVLMMLPVCGYNLYVLLSKLFIEGDLSFSFIGNGLYYRIAYILAILNIRYSWVYIFVGLGMGVSRMKIVTKDVK